MIMRTILLLAILLVLPISTYAATIHGTVYDLSLEPIGAFVEINSVPKQFVVAANGEYSFNINSGKYVLWANTSEGTAGEEIEIVDDGDYVIDIVIGLDIDDPIGFIDDEPIIDIIPDGTLDTGTMIMGIIIMVVLAGVIVLMFISQNHKTKKTDTVEATSNEVSDIEVKMVTLIRQHSRITQKELRKMLPYSEAKISLVVAQLEAEGKIKKIKKGRGNILVYIKG